MRPAPRTATVLMKRQSDFQNIVSTIFEESITVIKLAIQQPKYLIIIITYLTGLLGLP